MEDLITVPTLAPHTTAPVTDLGAWTCHVDAAIFSNTRLVDFNAVFEDNEWHFLRAYSGYYEGIPSPLLAEALALKSFLLFIQGYM